MHMGVQGGNKHHSIYSTPARSDTLAFISMLTNAWLFSHPPEVMAPLAHAVGLINGKAQQRARVIGLLQCITGVVAVEATAKHQLAPLAAQDAPASRRVFGTSPARMHTHAKREGGCCTILVERRAITCAACQGKTHQRQSAPTPCHGPSLSACILR